MLSKQKERKNVPDPDISAQWSEGPLGPFLNPLPTATNFTLGVLILFQGRAIITILFHDIHWICVFQAIHRTQLKCGEHADEISCRKKNHFCKTADDNSN